MTRQPIKQTLPKCRYHKTRFYPSTGSSTQQYCLRDKECREAAEKAVMSKLKAKREKELKADRKETRERKEKLKTLGQYEIEAKAAFQEWVRLRDKDLPCISCGNANSPRYDGGHWWKAELYSGLIFHEDNCHKQCSRPCNKDLNGDQANYRIGLVKRIGIERVTWLEENKDRLRVYKYTKEQLLELKQKYKLKIKELK